VLAAGAACRRRYDLSFMPSSRRVPPPWLVDEQEACFIVRDANGQALAVENSPSHSLFNGRDCPDAYLWWT